METLIAVLLSLFSHFFEVSKLLQPSVKVVQHECLSTTFGHPGDKWTGGNARCTNLPVGPETLGIAHRTLPCGTLVRITNPNTGLYIDAPVIDRGPYGALLPDGTWVLKRTRSDPGKWRGCVDLTPLTGDSIGHTGLQRVTIAYVSAR